MQEEYDAHIASSPQTQFSPSPEADAEVASTTRNLETKRQIASLTRREQEQLRQIDELTERIARFNSAAAAKSPPPARHTYDLAGGKPRGENDESLPAVVPRISAEEAEKIILHLDEQFEQKVLSRLPKAKNIAPAPASSAPDKVPDFTINPAGEIDSGRNLQDYLASVRAEPPRLPFQDEDSHIDLSKLHDRLRPV